MITRSPNRDRQATIVTQRPSSKQVTKWHLERQTERNIYRVRPFVQLNGHPAGHPAPPGAPSGGWCTPARCAACTAACALAAPASRSRVAVAFPNPKGYAAGSATHGPAHAAALSLSLLCHPAKGACRSHVQHKQRPAHLLQQPAGLLWPPGLPLRELVNKAGTRGIVAVIQRHLRVGARQPGGQHAQRPVHLPQQPAARLWPGPGRLQPHRRLATSAGLTTVAAQQKMRLRACTHCLSVNQYTSGKQPGNRRYLTRGGCTGSTKVHSHVGIQSIKKLSRRKTWASYLWRQCSCRRCICYGSKPHQIALELLLVLHCGLSAAQVECVVDCLD